MQYELEWFITLKRFGDQTKRIRKEQDETRLGFEVDYDRIVFHLPLSLQDKPGNTFLKQTLCIQD